MKKISIIFLFFLLLNFLFCREKIVISPTAGPKTGTLFMAGGNKWSTPIIMDEFKRLAGGNDCYLTVVPTNQIKNKNRKPEEFIDFWKKLGYKNVNILYFSEADKGVPEEILIKLKKSNAVWFYGGDPMLHLKFYKNTKIEETFFEILEKGGVIGGPSAGAMIQAEWILWAFNSDVKNYNEFKTFSFAASGITIIPHVDKRKLWDKLIPIVQSYPEILGLGITEGAVAIIQKNTLRVLGDKIAVYDSSVTTNECRDDSCFFLLDHGDMYNIKTRKQIN